MGAVPDEKQGVASAVNDATREIGEQWVSRWPDHGLAAGYTHALMPMLAEYPARVRDPALGSLAEALAVAVRRARAVGRHRA
jgi:hypothetical protein